VLVSLAQTSAGQAALRAAGVSGRPAAYAALSFPSPAQLPAQLYSAEALLEVPFAVRNSDTTAHRFSWTMRAVHDGQTRQLAAGQTEVGPGASAVISRNVLASCVGGQLKVVVQLAAPRESIAYWVACWPGPGSHP
jgi:hypothetical protein